MKKINLLGAILLISVLTLNFATVVYADPATPPLAAPDSTSPQGCSDSGPLSSPRLFQINTTNTSATLYFTVANGPVSYYSIIYGYKPADFRFGAIYNPQINKGNLSYTIHDLQPGRAYYFYVVAGNGCSASLWSNSLMAKPGDSPQAIYTAWDQLRDLVKGWMR